MRLRTRRCAGAVVQATAPAHLIEGALPTEALLAHVLVAKYADHLPLYRQAQIYARAGVDLSRAVLAGMKSLAARAGFSDLIAPVRPTLKARYPLTPMERYVRWNRRQPGRL